MNNKVFFKFDLGCLPTNVCVAIGYDSLEEVEDKFEVFPGEYEEQREEGEQAFTFFCDRTGNCCLFFYDDFRYMQDLRILVHEINHASFYIIKYCGMELSEATTEVYAYVSDYIFKEITSYLEKKQGLALCIKKRK